MKFTIKKELLLDSLLKVSKAISTKNLIPVLAGIKFELKKKKLTLTASDNDITIQSIIESTNDEDFKIEKEGSIIIQGRYILDIVRKLPAEYINIEVIDDLKILIYTENSEFNLNGISESEYPSINLEESKKRSANISFPRQIAMYLCRNMTTESFPKIAIEFGGKDHTTVMYSVEKIENEIKINKDLANIIEKLKKDIGGV